MSETSKLFSQLQSRQAPSAPVSGLARMTVFLGLILWLFTAGAQAASAASCANPQPAATLNGSVTDDIPTDFDPTANPQPQTTIYFTVLLPPRCPGQTFPLVLHSHGWGGSRITSLAANGDLKPDEPMFASVDDLVKALPYHGYEVISFDERGHGESTNANARVIDPLQHDRSLQIRKKEVSPPFCLPLWPPLARAYFFPLKASTLRANSTKP